MKKLPKGWNEVKLSEIGELIMGQSPPGESYNNKGKGLPLINGAADYDKNVLFPNQFTTKPTRISRKNDIIFCIRATIGKVVISEKEYCLGRGVAAVRVKNNSINRIYISRIIDRELKKLVLQGTTIKGVRKEDLYSIKIPLPPISTQKKIVSILEKAEKLKEWRKGSNELTDQLLKSVFLDMIGDIVKNPKKWPVKTVEEVCTDIVDCPHSTPEYVEGITDFPCIRTTELRNGYIDWAEMKYLDEKNYKIRIKRLKPEENDIIYGREGSFGEAVRVPKNTNISLGQRVMLLRPNKKICNPIFFWAMIRSDALYQQAIKKTNSSTVGHVNIKDIKKFTVIVPDISVQNKFSKIVENVERNREYQKQSKVHIDNLFNSLMQKAFNGELV